MSMFNFFSMASDYDSRKVDRLDASWGFISTAYVNDADKPYETAVCHEEYNDGLHVIVETYDTKSEAQEGHNRWVETMTAAELPTELVDRGESGARLMAGAFSNDSDWIYPRGGK
jgi:hypothetical protein